MPNFPSELRRSTLSNRWVMIAAGRAKRPHEFAEDGASQAHRDPFDPANIPPSDIVATLPNDTPEAFTTEADWKVLAMKNAFPFVAPEKNPDVRGRVRDGYGFHELVIHSPDADKNFEDFSTEQTQAVLQMYRKRLVVLSAEPHIKYVQIFTNRGKEAGASVIHPHSQIVALPVVPPRVELLLDAAKEHFATTKKSLVDDEAEAESTATDRLIESNDHFVVYCPFAPQTNYHVRILPKQGEPLFRDMTPEQEASLAAILNRTHQRLNAVADVPPYNVLFRTAPDGESDLAGFRWHIDIVTRGSILGGLELATGLDVITVAPEAAAAELRDAI